MGSSPTATGCFRVRFSLPTHRRPFCRSGGRSAQSISSLRSSTSWACYSCRLPALDGASAAIIYLEAFFARRIKAPAPDLAAPLYRPSRMTFTPVITIPLRAFDLTREAPSELSRPSPK